MNVMKAEELLQAGQLEDSLASLQESVRNNAADPKLRVFLFQVLSVLGRWDRALTQLGVLTGMGSDYALLGRIFESVVQCESLRSEVFAGRHSPIIFGEPLEWVGMLVQANELVARNQFGAAQDLRDKAFEAAPATPGKLNDKPFEWIADADMRLGPILEAIVEGSYYWIPFCRIKRIHIEPPSDLRDLVWAPAQFLWENGGEASGHIPTRYPATEIREDDQLRLSKKTEWIEKDGGYNLGLGQRVLSTDSDELGLLECRTIDLTPAG
jgi:type VI secretion system protein ImpE